MSRPVLVRGLSSTPDENVALVHLVITALKDSGWASVTPADVQIEDKSGGGGSKCYRLTATDGGAVPPVVALHSFFNEKTGKECLEFTGRMADASQVFSDGGLGPRRLAQGGDWFIEVWEGSGEPDFASPDTFRELGALVANVHKLPITWYDVWRERACERQPLLKSVPHGSHVWWYACKTWDCYEALPQNAQALEFWIKDNHCFSPSPTSTEWNRLVTSHGDCHPGNMIQTDSGVKLLDYEYTAVRSALFDVAFVFMWADSTEKKRVFLKQYLQSSGLPSDEETLDRLYLDAALYGAATHIGPLWYGCVQSGDMERAREVEALIYALRADPDGVRNFVEPDDHDIVEAVANKRIVLKAAKGTDFRNFEALSTCSAVHQTWFVKTKDRHFFLQVNLAGGGFARYGFCSQGPQHLAQGTYTFLRSGRYSEKITVEGGVRLTAKLPNNEKGGSDFERVGELVGDATDFHLMVDGDTYTPVGETMFPWAIPIARVDVQRDQAIDLSNYEDLCGDAKNCNQLFVISKWDGRRFFQYNFGAGRKFLFINIDADQIYDVSSFTWESGIYRETAEPNMKGPMQGDGTNFFLEFDGEPHGRHEFIPVPWDLISWADEKVAKKMRAMASEDQ